jgi:hypothetical protein
MSLEGQLRVSAKVGNGQRTTAIANTTLVCWGDANGQLGDGTLIEKLRAFFNGPIPSHICNRMWEGIGFLLPTVLSGYQIVNPLSVGVCQIR